MDALVVVPVDVVSDFLGEGFDAGESFSVEHFGFEVGEEVFHDGVVVAVAFTGHGLNAVNGSDEVTPGIMAVMESLIRVNNETGLWVVLVDGVLK